MQTGSRRRPFRTDERRPWYTWRFNIGSVFLLVFFVLLLRGTVTNEFLTPWERNVGAGVLVLCVLWCAKVLWRHR